MKSNASSPCRRPRRCPQVLEHMATLADPLRCRVLLLLERHELTVTELCAVLQLPQSTVSRHLKTLADGGWVTLAARRHVALLRSDAAAGTVGGAPVAARSASRSALGSAAEQDDRRLKGVLEQRRSTSEAFFSKASGQWDQLRADLFGQAFHAQAALALLDDALRVGDLGCGTGQLSALLAPHVGDGDRRRRIGRHAAGGAGPAGRPRQRRGPARRARGPADRRRAARRRGAGAGAAPPARSGAGAGRGGARAGARRPRADRRHAAARPPRLPGADGPRLARLRRGPDPPVARRRRLRRACGWRRCPPSRRPRARRSSAPWPCKRRGQTAATTSAARPASRRTR